MTACDFNSVKGVPVGDTSRSSGVCLLKGVLRNEKHL
jgi:hypothetical protein